MKTFILLIVCIFLGALTSCSYNTTSPQLIPNIWEGTGSSFQSTGISMQSIVSLTPFMARGTEPFWALEQTSTGVKFSRPDTTGTGMILETWYTSVQTNSGTTIMINATPITVDLPISTTLTLGTCTDGMSDIVYTYSITLAYGTGILSGCAN